MSEQSAHHSFTELDDYIQASLRTLVLAKHSSKNGKCTAHSQHEIESAHVSLNQVIRTAEFIKEKLRHSGDNVSKDATKSRNSLNPSETQYCNNETVGTANENDVSTFVSNSETTVHESVTYHHEREQPTQCEETSKAPNGISSTCLQETKAPKRSSTNIFGRGQPPLIHPSDLETGSNHERRRNRFSHQASRRKESASGWKMTAREAFNIIDENGDGYLQREEVVRAIEMMAEHGEMDLDGMTPSELADEMMSEGDTDGDGQIDIDEFTEVLRQRSSDIGKPGAVSYNLRMSQLAQNVLVAHQKKLEQSIIGRDKWLVHPLSNFHATWDIIVSILILLTVVTMPLSLGWETINESFFAMNLIVDMIFMLDVCKNFCTGYVDENEAIILDSALVRRNYLTGFFVTDFCSSIPLDLILRAAGIESNVGGTVSGTKQSLKMLKLLRITKVFRLFRLNRLFLQVKRLALLLEEVMHVRISDGFTKLLRLGVGAMILAHWIGCFNFMLVRLHDFPPDSWIVYAGLEKQSSSVQWSWSFYKALAQMVMIGFQTPPFTNGSCDAITEWCTIEHWTTLVCLYIGAIFYSLLISSISSILHTANQASRQFDEHLSKVDGYMRTKKLPAVMREKVKDYFYLQFSNGELHREEEILDFLSPVLRREIKEFTGRDLCKRVPMLSMKANREFAGEISCCIEPNIVFANEIIVREKTSGEEMFFIHSGVVEIFVSSSQLSSYVAIGDGCYFGEVSLLLGIQRTASAKSRTQCMLYRLAKSRLLTLLQDHPFIEAKMTEIAQIRRRRLAHYLDPKTVPLAQGDEIDAEDCQTELFGVDADKILRTKEEEYNKERISSGIRSNRRHQLSNGSISGGNGQRRRYASISKQHLPVRLRR